MPCPGLWGCQGHGTERWSCDLIWSVGLTVARRPKDLNTTKTCPEMLTVVRREREVLVQPSDLNVT